MTDKYQIKVDIIIPVYGELKVTRDCIESIISNTKISFRFIVVDNKSDLVTKNSLNLLKTPF